MSAPISISSASATPLFPPLSLSSIEKTFASLIQQYLFLLHHENATFLAERFVAHNSTPYSNYLLAMCHYRSNKPKKAKSILTTWSQKTVFYGGDASSALMGESILYLLAKCCVDLELWNEAEDTLLRTARAEYAAFKKQIKERLNQLNASTNSNGGNNSNINSNNGDNPVLGTPSNAAEHGHENTAASATNNNNNTNASGSDEMNIKQKKKLQKELNMSLDEWLAIDCHQNNNTTTNPAASETSNDVFPCTNNFCPIPNGAAGLNLLGLICQRTMRKEKACLYYRLSLTLDPMMWTSYEALCEMGVATKQQNDPVSIFGVLPPCLANIPTCNGGYKNNYNHHKKEMSNLNSKTSSSNEKHADNTPHASYYNSNNNNMSMQQHQQQHNQSLYDNQEFLRRIREESEFESHHNFILNHTSPIMNDSSIINNNNNTASTTVQGYGHSHGHPSNSFVPQTPYTTQQQSHPQYNIGGSSHGHHTNYHHTHQNSDDSTTMQSTSFFNNHNGQPTSTSTRSATSNHPKNLPSTTLFATPGLTPIQPSKEVLSRAKQVASRLYYEPSPEMTPPHLFKKGIMNQNAAVSAVAASMGSASATTPSFSSLKSTRRKQYKSRTEMIHEGEVFDNTNSNFHDNDGDTMQNPNVSMISSKGGERLLFDGMGMGEASPSPYNNNDNSKLTPIHVHGPRSSSKSKRTGTGEGYLDHERKGNHDQEYKDHIHDDDGDGDEHDKINDDEAQGTQKVLELLCVLGAAQRMLCSFHCKEALQIFRTLPNNQYNTGWVQHQVGRAYFEMADYPSAQRALETMQRVEPHRLKGLELLSTALWHLKKEVELSSLAQRVADFDKMAPESWCVVGNCFSLQKEHETSLAFFRRSIQLDSSFTYAHTLSGHEYVSNEDFDQAVACFRNAIRNDDRHYTAWYGLGAIYFRQEKYDLAEYHFKKALTINPQSSVLHCHLGMAQHASGKNQEALETLAGAFRVDPRNPQARYQRATIWMSIDKPNEALKELEKVRDAAPREASVHFAMGKVLKRLGKPEEAMRCFLTALDLDPKDNNLIKAAIDRLDDPDVLEADVSAF